MCRRRGGRTCTPKLRCTSVYTRRRRSSRVSNNTGQSNRIENVRKQLLRPRFVLEREITLTISPCDVHRPSRNYSIFTTSMRLLPLSSLASISPVLPFSDKRPWLSARFTTFSLRDPPSSGSNEATNSRNKAAGKCSYPQSSRFPPSPFVTSRLEQGEANFFTR